MNQIKRTERMIEELREKLAHPPETENLEDIQNEIVRQPGFVIVLMVTDTRAESAEY